MADPRTRTSPARFLAPLALIAVLVTFFAILSESGGGGSSSSSNQGSQTTGSTSGSKTASGKTGSSSSTTTARAKKKRRNYIVKVNDTFGTIAGKTGVSVETLQTLNPAVDPHSMTVGQQIRLR
jgi:LysM repeat protein